MAYIKKGGGILAQQQALGENVVLFLQLLHIEAKLNIVEK
jgi:Tfp pilus assembly protein PilZ